ncbi:MAG: carbon storage regulator [Clostridia bacterium]|nr:carbon storage regulator [Clostridia bacterium]
MLVLTRRVNETIVIGANIEVTVVGIEEDKVRLGIKAPPEINIVRRELFEAVRSENRAAAQNPRIPLDGLKRG